MPEHRTEPEPSNFNLRNILSAIFKWKRTILGFATFGILAAAGIYFFYPAVYESDARLLVRYVLERSAVDPVDAMSGQSGRSGIGVSSDGVIGAEVSILTSWDLSVQVAEALGPNRVLPDTKAPSVVAAAAVINSGLATTTAKGSNIIGVSYQNPKPGVATAVLNELVNRYFTKHLEVHRSAGAFDFVSQQTDQIRGRLGQTEDTLKQLKAKAGILDLKDSVSALNDEAAKTAQQLSIVEGDLAEQRAKVKLMEGSAGLRAPDVEQTPSKSSAGATPIPGPPPSSANPAAPVSATPSPKNSPEYTSPVTKSPKLRQT